MVVAVSMVKDEGDIIEHTLERMVDEVDAIIVADNGSTDGTRELLNNFPVVVVDDPEPGYYQSEKMSALAERAINMGADWIIPFDADEVWRARNGSIRDVLHELPGWAWVAEAALYDHVATALDRDELDPVRRLRYRREHCLPLPKVACRARYGMVIHQGNHGVTYPDNDHPGIVKNLLVVRHFPYRSPEQFVKKARNGAAAYAATDLPLEVGAHWRGYGAIIDADGDRAGYGIFREWFYEYDPLAKGLVHDPCP